MSFGDCHLPLPRWVHIPGEGTEPDDVTLAPAIALVPDWFQDVVPAAHPALHYGLNLNDAGFFWECHEILEAIWAVAPRGGRDRILLRACIQIANAHLKMRLKQPRAVVRLMGEALAELKELTLRRAGKASGFADSFPADALSDRLQRGMEDAATSDERPVLFAFIPRR